MTSENELNNREVERLKRLLEIFPRDADVEDVADLIENAKAVMRVVKLLKYVVNVVTVAGAGAIAYYKWFKGAVSQ